MSSILLAMTTSNPICLQVILIFSVLAITVAMLLAYVGKQGLQLEGLFLAIFSSCPSLSAAIMHYKVLQSILDLKELTDFLFFSFYRTDSFYCQYCFEFFFKYQNMLQQFIVNFGKQWYQHCYTMILLSRLIKARMSILHVAQKNSIAKEVANVLSRASKRSIPTISKYNPIFQFQLQSKTHRFSSVRGHIFDYELPQQCKNWKGFDNKKILLSEVPMIKREGPDMNQVIRNIQKLARQSKELILWLDCDRQGQAIAFQVIQICTQVNPRLKIKRARFSAVTPTDVWNAYNGLVEPNKLEADAVNYRIQIDFRTGCTFTRYQTIVFQRYFQTQSGSFLSYGPCQMPTLSFVVHRYLEIKNFKPEKYWFIEMVCIIDQNTGIPFVWEKKNTRSEAQANQALYKILSPFPDGQVMVTVNERKKNPKKKYRPYPLTTVKFQKLATDKLRLSSAKAMQLAEKLYQKGYISYPRTQTDAFPKTMNLKNLVQRLEGSERFGGYVKKLLQQNKFVPPKAGNSNDEAHTPIHPVKLAQQHELASAEQWKVYDLITRSFLAACSADAIGQQFQVKAEVSGQKFKASYLTIKQRNFLQIFPFQKWVETSFPADIPDKFPAMVTLKDAKTNPPGYMTQSQLIDMMEKNQIGTDSTIHQHIQTIQKRQYAIKSNNTFKPTNLGASLVQTYEQLSIDLPKCQIRRKIQQKMNRIQNGEITRDAATKQTLDEMIPIYEKLETIKDEWLQKMKKYMQSNAQLKKIDVGIKSEAEQQGQNRKSTTLACKCQLCGQNAYLRFSQKTGGYFIGCSKFPACRWLQGLPSYIEEVKQTQNICAKCNVGQVVKIKAKQGKAIEPMIINILFSESQDQTIQACINPTCNRDLYEYVNQFQSHRPNNPNQNYNSNSNSNTNFTSNNRSNSTANKYSSNHQQSYDIKKKFNEFTRSFNQGNSTSNHKLSKSNNSIQNLRQKKSNSTNSHWSSNQEKKQIICYRCKEPGHIAPQCPQAGGGGGDSGGGNYNKKYNDFKSGFPQKKGGYTKKSKSQVSVNDSENDGSKKVCPDCGVQGRHPNGSSCPSVVKKRKQK